MEKLFFILSREGKFKADISRYVTMKFAYKDADIWFGIDNHLPKQTEDSEDWAFTITEDYAKANNIKFGKKQAMIIDGKTNANNFILQGVLDIPQFREAVDEKYNSIMEFERESSKACTDLLVYVHWNKSLNDFQIENMERILEMVKANYRVRISPNEHLMLADFTNMGALPNRVRISPNEHLMLADFTDMGALPNRVRILPNEHLMLADFTDMGALPNRELHVQYVQTNKNKQGEFVRCYPDLCPEEIVNAMAKGLKTSFNEINNQLQHMEIENDDRKHRQKYKYLMMMDKFIPLTKEDIDEKLL